MVAKRILLILLAACMLTAASACGGRIPYYHQESSAVESSEEPSDTLPRFVFGENGLYDTVNDIEYVRLEGVSAKTVGEPYASGQRNGQEVVFYAVADQNPSYLLCDAEGNIYKNTVMPMLSMPGDSAFEEQYPGLRPSGEDPQ